MDRFILLATIISLSACRLLSVGDGAMGIAGNLSKYKDQDCLARVLLLSDREVWRFELLPDSNGNFSHDFTVAPRSEEYKIKIECNGEVIGAKKILYPKDLNNSFYLNFGELG